LLRDNLQKTWEQALQQMCQELLEAAGADAARPELGEFLWAYSIFWCGPCLRAQGHHWLNPIIVMSFLLHICRLKWGPVSFHRLVGDPMYGIIVPYIMPASFQSTAHFRLFRTLNDGLLHKT
jgi:hypothetical protein